jgi:hypothetical protein
MSLTYCGATFFVSGLKGHGFSRANVVLKIHPASAPEVLVSKAYKLVPQAEGVAL